MRFNYDSADDAAPTVNEAEVVDGATMRSRYDRTNDSTHTVHEAEVVRQEAVTLRAELEATRAEVASLRQQLDWQAADWPTIRVSSPLINMEFTEWRPNESRENMRYWESWCPCCKRPLDITAFGIHDSHYNWENDQAHEPQAKHSTVVTYAYVAAIWGEGSGLSGFVVGALVLATALRRRGTRHDLVLLHTADVPAQALEMLSKCWKLHLVEYVAASKSLFGCKDKRFDGVFTKLHVLGLTDYDKVLMLDIDLAVLRCPDALFELPAPAAMRRGYSAHVHGGRMHGRSFFGGFADNWGQCGGINAGVMLLKPDTELHKRALKEVQMPVHPEHIAGGGPEQDYLSRFYASYPWTHISVLYNFQLHHVFYALEAAILHVTGASGPPDHWAHVDDDSTDCDNDIKDNTVLRCFCLPSNYDKLPVFQSPDSFHIVGHVELGTELVASGSCVKVKNCPMVPVRWPFSGAVDGRQVQVVANTVVTAETESDEVPSGYGLSPEHGSSSPLSHCHAVTVDTNAARHQAEELQPWTPVRLAVDPEDVHIVHFSGHLKLWDKDPSETDDDFVNRLLRFNSPQCTRLWLDQAGDEKDYAEYGLRLTEGAWHPLNCETQQFQQQVQGIVEHGILQVKRIALQATVQWHHDLDDLAGQLELSSGAELFERLQQFMSLPIVSTPSEPAVEYPRGTRVEVFWWSDDKWYPGTVKGIPYPEDSRSRYSIDFDDFTTDAAVEASCLRRLNVSENILEMLV